MSSIQVKHVEPAVHDAVRERAAEAGVTVSEYLLELVRQDLRKPRRSEWLARLATRDPVELTTDDLVAGLEEQRDARCR